MKKTKRLLAVILTVVMLIGSVSVIAITPSSVKELDVSTIGYYEHFVITEKGYEEGGHFTEFHGKYILTGENSRDNYNYPVKIINSGTLPFVVDIQLKNCRIIDNNAAFEFSNNDGPIVLNLESSGTCELVGDEEPAFMTYNESVDAYINVLDGSLKLDSSYWSSNKICDPYEMTLHINESTSVDGVELNADRVLDGKNGAILRRTEGFLLETTEVTFDNGGGAGEMPPVTVTKGTRYPLPACEFTGPEGKLFGGWDLGQQGDCITVNGPTKATAKWVDAVTVSFDANGGKGTIEGASVPDGGRYTLPQCTITPPDESFMFQKWEIGTGAFAGPNDIVTINGDTVIKPVWEKLMKVSFDPNGGSGTVPPVYVRKGEDFFSDDADGTLFTPPEDCYFLQWDMKSYWLQINEDTVIKALWGKCLYMDFDANGGTGTMDRVTVKSDLDGTKPYTIPECKFTPPEGKRFFAWDLGAAGKKITASKHMQYKAIWVDDEVNLAYDSEILKPIPSHYNSPYGAVDGDYITDTKMIDNNFDLIIKTPAPLTLDHARIVCAGINGENQSNFKDFTIQVLKDEEKYRADAMGSDLGDDSLWMDIASISGETKFYSDLSTTVKESHQVYRIYVTATQGKDNPAVAEIEFYGTSNESIDPTPTVEVKFDSNGSKDTMNTVLLRRGTVSYVLPECTMTPPDGKYFLKWDLGAPGATVTLGNGFTLKPVWEDLVTITLDPGTNGTGTMNSFVVKKGKEFTLPACTFTGNSGYTFVKWDKGVSGEKIVADGPMTLVAEWKSDGTNIALDAEVLYVSGGTGSTAFDGKPDTLWQHECRDVYDHSHYIVFKLPNPANVRKIVLKNIAANVYKLETLSDIGRKKLLDGNENQISKKPDIDKNGYRPSEDWKLIKGIENYDDSLRDETYEITLPESQKYFRLIITRGINGSPYIAGGNYDLVKLGEFEIYGDYEPLYTVKIDKADGVGSMNPSAVHPNSAYELPVCTIAPPAGKVFKAWDCGNLKECAPGEFIYVDKDMTIKPVWKDAPLNVTLVRGSGTDEVIKIEIEKGQKFKLPENKFIPPLHKLFDKWDKGKPGDEIVINENTVINAVWKDEVMDNGFMNDGSMEVAIKDAEGYYLVGNAGQLYWTAQKIINGEKDAKVKLTADIVINKNVSANLDKYLNLNTEGKRFRLWTPLASDSNRFKGIFDGQLHTISGLIVVKEKSDASMFGHADGATIKNLGITDAYFKGKYTSLLGFDNENTTISNFFMDAAMRTDTNDSYWNDFACGFAVNFKNSTIENSYVNIRHVGSYYVEKYAAVKHVTSSKINNFYFNNTDIKDMYSNCSGTVTNSAGKTPAEFADGSVAYLLNGSVTDGSGMWKQNLDVGTVDAFPKFVGGSVYNDGTGYTNKSAISMNISWGTMEFEFKEGKSYWSTGSGYYMKDFGKWECQKDANKISVTNTGRNNLNVTYSANTTETDLSVNITDGKNDITAPVLCNSGETKNAFVNVSGEWKDNTAKNKSIGSVTVTVQKVG